MAKLNLTELETACEDFSNIIDTGHGRIVYKGTLSSKVEIAVVSTAITCSKDWPKRAETAFWKEVCFMKLSVQHFQAIKKFWRVYLFFLFGLWFRLINCHVWTIRTSSIFLATVRRMTFLKEWWCLSMLQMEVSMSIFMVIFLFMYRAFGKENLNNWIEWLQFPHFHVCS